jgi:hypothetical protein
MSESSRNRIHSVELPLDANQGSVSLGLSERRRKEVQSTMQFLQRALLFFSAILPGFAFDRATSMQAQEAATLASAAVSLPDAQSAGGQACGYAVTIATGPFFRELRG